MTRERSPSLDLPLDEFRHHLDQCVEMIIERYETMYDADAHPAPDDQSFHDWFDEPLPEHGLALEKVLQTVDETVLAHPVMNIGTKMFAYVMSGGNQVSIAADLLAAALNQNVAKWHLAPAMTEIEQRLVAWTAQFMGLEHHHGGAIVTSGSAANLTGLTVARNIVAEQAGIRKKGLFGLEPLIVYGSDQTHTSVEKSIELLGIGSDNYRRIRTHDDFTIDVTALKDQIATDKAAGYTPLCIIGNAGTVNTGTIDPLASLAEIARDEKIWFHVDGAYGGLAASLPAQRSAYDGIECADSIALDYHKWLYQPYEVGCTLVKNWTTLNRTYHKSAEYLDYGVQGTRFDVSRHHFDLSRNAKAFKVWMSFKAYGAAQLREMISKDIDLAQYLATTIIAAPDFELCSDGSLAIVCFRYIGNNSYDDTTLDVLNAKLLDRLEADRRVFITGTHLNDHHVLRACIINHRMQAADIDYLIAVIRELAQAS